MGNPCISTFYTLKETSKQFQPHFIVPSAVPEKGEKEDKGDGNFPCERRRESLILQWRMEIENREPHLVPTYFCCAIQKKTQQMISICMYIVTQLTITPLRPNLLDLRFHRLFLDSLLKAVKFQNKSLVYSLIDPLAEQTMSQKNLKLRSFAFLGASDRI